MAETPMLAQYFALKEQYPDALLFFRLGDFYEMFGEDAITASKVLEITLTSRDAGKQRERLPMCGVPHHSVAGYLDKLIKHGFKVAICEQLEDPKQAKGVVKRDVVRVVTPGTYMEGTGDETRARYLAAAVDGPQDIGLALVDLSTGDFRSAVIPSFAKLADELRRVMPVEMLGTRELCANGFQAFAEERKIPCSQIDPRILKKDTPERLLKEHFGLHTLDAFGLQKRTAIQSAAAALDYLKDTQKNAVEHIRRIRTYDLERYLRIDGISVRNLELFQSLGDGGRSYSLFGVINQTVTSMGGRMLRSWMQQPLLDAAGIGERQDAVEILHSEAMVRRQLRELLDDIQDLERLLSRLVSGSGTPRDLAALKVSLQNVDPIRHLLEVIPQTLLLKDILTQLKPVPGLIEQLDAALVDDPPISSREGGMIRVGFHSELDTLRTASREGKDWIRTLEEQERQRTTIKSLKVGYNKVFGYYLEVTKPNIHLVPESYHRKQTLSNAERFVTPELKEKEALILGADERMCQLEYQLFVDLRAQVKEYVDDIQATAAALATLDALQSLAETAARRGYRRPQVVEDCSIEIKDGRHPVIEAVQPDFVPNNLTLNSDEQVLLLTGPNMAGKSTYLRQAALLVILGQMGSFVPAEAAVIGLVDRIFTRIGAGDDLSTGQSTFMVECAETANLLHNATQRSLIILDELGRGTSTYDGMAIAQGVIEHIHNQVRARTLFSTHYHGLTKLQETLAHLVTYRVEVEEAKGQVFFLHKVVRGNADRSYGINVAKMAGIPREIIRRSQDLLYQLEAGQKKPVQLDLFQSAQYASPSLNDADNEILEQLGSLELQNMTPLQALELLYKWQTERNGGEERG